MHMTNMRFYQASQNNGDDIKIMNPYAYIRTKT